MLTIRLTRKGKKNQPFFRVVVIDKRQTAKGGRAVEDLGFVDPLTKKKSFKKERILYWISKGAKPTPTIHNYLVAEKILDAKKINVSKKSKKTAEATPSAGSGQVVSAVEPAPEATSTQEAKSRSQGDRGSSMAEISGPAEPIAVENPKEDPKTKTPKEPTVAEASASDKFSAEQVGEIKETKPIESTPNEEQKSKEAPKDVPAQIEEVKLVEEAPKEQPPAA